MSKRQRCFEKARKLFKKRKGGNVSRYDEALAAVVAGEDFALRALTRIGENRESLKALDPIRFECCDYTGDSGDCYIRIFKDGSVRSSNYAVCFLIFGESRLFVYRYCFSLTGGGKAESLSEIDYRSISAVTSDTRYERVTDASETAFSVPVSRVTLTADGKDYTVTVPVGNPSSEVAVAALRKLIRSKK